MTGGAAILTALTLKNGELVEAIISGAMTVSFAGITLRSIVNAYNWNPENLTEEPRLVDNSGEV